MKCCLFSSGRNMLGERETKGVLWDGWRPRRLNEVTVPGGLQGDTRQVNNTTELCKCTFKTQSLTLSPVFTGHLVFVTSIYWSSCHLHSLVIMSLYHKICGHFVVHFPVIILQKSAECWRIAASVWSASKYFYFFFIFVIFLFRLRLVQVERNILRLALFLLRPETEGTVDAFVRPFPSQTVPARTWVEKSSPQSILVSRQ